MSLSQYYLMCWLIHKKNLPCILGLRTSVGRGITCGRSCCRRSHGSGWRSEIRQKASEKGPWTVSCRLNGWNGGGTGGRWFIIGSRSRLFVWMTVIVGISTGFVLDKHRRISNNTILLILIQAAFDSGILRLVMWQVLRNGCFGLVCRLRIGQRIRIVLVLFGSSTWLFVWLCNTIGGILWF